MLYSIPLPYPADTSTLFSAIKGLPWPAWLDGGGMSRYDILVADPVVTLVDDGSTIQMGGAAGVHRVAGDPFDLLREALSQPVAPLPDIPFAGGALGYWGYDLARRYHQLSARTADAADLPWMAVGIYDWAILVDHQEQEVRLVSRLRYPQTEQRLEEVAGLLQAGAAAAVEKPFRVRGAVRSNLTAMQYREAFEAVQRYLHQGDCYQVNLAQRFSASSVGDAYPAYLELRRISPAPHSAFLDWPFAQVMCASPERFLQVRDGLVQTKPIKGTRPRHAERDEDVRLADDLRTHPKDRAENLMIVDLLRNDLGKDCEPGSVQTPALFALESYANVHHLVSTVQGRLRQDRDALDLLRDCFPGGSITGAPKLRAMEIIEELEPHGRGVYCGAIGYVGFDGAMDTNIAIRTLVHAGGEVRCWAGGGIVADSQWEEEYRETQDKASAMLELLRRFTAA